MKELKRVSNIWVKERGPEWTLFAWQSGYGCFSVSQSNVTRESDSIANQEAHHGKISYRDEFRALLRKHDIEWDERYVWD